MKCFWLGQAGLLFQKGGFSVMIDPYLSDSVEKAEPENRRRVPVDERFFAIRPNVMIFTHDHLDHYDPETAARFLTPESGILVLSPRSVWEKVKKTGGRNHYVLFGPGTVWTENGIRFTAVRAVHSDPEAIGVILDDGEKKIYVTGDTLYHEAIFPALPRDIDVLFLPVNGVGNNMNLSDAARFAARVGARKTVPIHFGMFDALSPEDFSCENKVIPEIYKEVSL